MKGSRLTCRRSVCRRGRWQTAGVHHQRGPLCSCPSHSSNPECLISTRFPASCFRSSMARTEPCRKQRVNRRFQQNIIPVGFTELQTEHTWVISLSLLHTVVHTIF